MPDRDHLSNLSADNVAARALGLELLRLTTKLDTPYDIGASRDAPRRAVAVASLARSRRFLRGAYRLADLDLVPESIAGTRSMLEYYVTLHWLLEDWDTRFAVLNGDEQRLRIARMNALITAHGDSPEWAATLAGLEATYGDLKRQLGRERIDMPPIEQRANSLPESLAKMIYGIQYRYESATGPHPTISGLQLFTVRDGDGFRVNPEPVASELLPNAYIVGAGWLCEHTLLAMRVDDALADRGRIRDLQARLMAFTEEWDDE